MRGSARIEAAFIQRAHGTLRFLCEHLMRASGAFAAHQAAEVDGRAAQASRGSAARRWASPGDTLQ